MKYNEQIKAWAIDRAIETLKIGSSGITPESVLETAQKYVEYTHTPGDDDDAGE